MKWVSFKALTWNWRTLVQWVMDISLTVCGLYPGFGYEQDTTLVRYLEIGGWRLEVELLIDGSVEEVTLLATKVDHCSKDRLSFSMHCLNKNKLWFTLSRGFWGLTCSQSGCDECGEEHERSWLVLILLSLNPLTNLSKVFETTELLLSQVLRYFDKPNIKSDWGAQYMPRVWNLLRN